MTELMALLENADVLGKFKCNQKRQLASLAVRRVLKRDETLFWQDDICTSVLLIATGRLRSVIHSLDGKSYVVSTWEQGEEFWAHTLFDGEPMPSTLEAVQDSIIYQWDGESTLRILFENKDALSALLSRQVKLIRKRRETISDLAFQPVTGRLAKLLLEQVPPSENSAQRELDPQPNRIHGGFLFRSCLPLAVSTPAEWNAGNNPRQNHLARSCRPRTSGRG